MPEMLALRETDPREVGAYRLLGRLGEGGQGVVFLAEGPTGSSAALKLLPPTTDPQVRSRFLKEVAAAQRVARFCTAQVLDAGIFERRPFIVSEYVSGPSLVEIVEQLGPRGGAALERIAVATLTALGAVHAAGMVHRDFKPANVLLGPDGPVVIDFGLAAVPGMTTDLSGEATVGTPAFMAPEQLAGSRVTAAADMWSWAVTMVFAGTGELPFKGESLTAMAYAILHSEPSVGRLPEPLGSLVRRCLNKDPGLADRPAMCSVSWWPPVRSSRDQCRRRSRPCLQMSRRRSRPGLQMSRRRSPAWLQIRRQHPAHRGHRPVHRRATAMI